jgi:uncharacterized membrane protein
MWWGTAAGEWLLRRRSDIVRGCIPRAASPLAWLGRRSLPWYMVHQPVMIGLLILVHARV